MVIVSITDIHGRQNIDRATARALAAADLLVVTGDITQFGNEADARLIIENLQSINSNLICIPGNCDQLSVNQYLSSLDLNLHAAAKVIDGLAFYGLGGSSRTPFGTPQEYGDDVIRDILTKFHKDQANRFHILVSHNPPYGTKVDQTLLGIHAGSKAVREFIDDFQPDLCLCGHIHEAIGSDRIGNTLILNPGPFPKHYARIEINDAISFSLF
jgi:Icc-related predicted phosphoesterase